MERKTYYMILGVSSTESPNGIRAAYRDLAKRLHPDVAGEQATRSFQEVSEAYAVLSDPQRRREYNDKLSRIDDGGIAIARRAPPEPLARDPVTILRSRDGVRPSFEAMYERFLRNFTGLGFPKSERVEGLEFEVRLTREEASRGCVVPVRVPVCARSHQQGMIESEELLRIRIPPLTPSGSTHAISLRGLGIHNFYLRLHIFVEAQPG